MPHYFPRPPLLPAPPPEILKASELCRALISLLSSLVLSQMQVVLGVHGCAPSLAVRLLRKILSLRKKLCHSQDAVPSCLPIEVVVGVAKGLPSAQLGVAEPLPLAPFHWAYQESQLWAIWAKDTL